jgi:hypothetical protein
MNFDWTGVLGLDSPWSTELAFFDWYRLLPLDSPASTGLAYIDWTRLLRLDSPYSTGPAFLDWPGLRPPRQDAPTSTGFASATVLCRIDSPAWICELAMDLCSVLASSWRCCRDSFSALYLCPVVIVILVTGVLVLWVCGGCSSSVWFFHLIIALVRLVPQVLAVHSVLQVPTRHNHPLKSTFPLIRASDRRVQHTQNLCCTND